MMDMGFILNLIKFTCLVDGLCKRGNIKQSFELKEMVRRVVRPNVYAHTTLINSFARRDGLFVGIAEFDMKFCSIGNINTRAPRLVSSVARLLFKDVDATVPNNTCVSIGGMCSRCPTKQRHDIV